MKKKFREAAKMIEDGKYGFACVALENVTHFDNRHLKLFKRYFKQKTIDIDGGWFGPSNDEQNQLARAIALDLMAEIVEE